MAFPTPGNQTNMQLAAISTSINTQRIRRLTRPTSVQVQVLCYYDTPLPSVATLRLQTCTAASPVLDWLPAAAVQRGSACCARPHQPSRCTTCVPGHASPVHCFMATHMPLLSAAGPCVAMKYCWPRSTTRGTWGGMKHGWAKAGASRAPAVAGPRCLPAARCNTPARLCHTSPMQPVSIERRKTCAICPLLSPLSTESGADMVSSTACPQRLPTVQARCAGAA
jgi:hypothetical protein